MKRIYAIVGESTATVINTDSIAAPVGYILMSSDRPDKDSVAAADGTWVPAPPVIPSVVSRAQGKAALVQYGLWDSVVAYWQGLTDPTDKALADIALNDTAEYRRDSPFLNAAATALGLTSEQLDALFVEAALIKL